ncbi:putative potassium channel beta subunit protein [Ceraceosorus guamensis]|uniref:Putative potassium channel beta subunit protein n=1 Tax=Ceraceosorus guamensis TaxID=1522189 RepID=A0A316W907_9BASI|nr:putative potassium channel beta subunit protein [Ceraceosorus guamensis]PWN46312.1 putative potassium channel beta subunit protein [Ceraceosorus guamensis]
MSHPTYDPKNMIFQRLGDSGLRVSKFSLGGWLTYGGTVDTAKTKEILKVAFENGISTFDTAEVYSGGECEIAMGQAVKELGWRRSDVVLITKIFFGTGSKDPNGRGLSRKHLVEGTDASLERAGLKYWDVIMAHRPDVSVPMHEIVRGFNHLIDTGRCFYWGTSEWTAQQIEEAHGVADKLGLIPPVADQAKYSALHREKIEKEYAPLYKKYGYGLTTWSPLESGLLTGKYNDIAQGKIPDGSRYQTKADTFTDTIAKLKTPEGQAKIEKVKGLTKIAESLGTSVAILSLAWAASNPNVSTVILGASKTEQVLENLKALDILPKLTPEVHEQIEKVLANKPEPDATYGRAPRDTLARRRARL